MHVLSHSPAQRGPAGGLEVAPRAPWARPPPPIAAIHSSLQGALSCPRHTFIGTPGAP